MTELAQIAGSAQLNLSVAHNGQLVSSAATTVGEALILAHRNTT